MALQSCPLTLPPLQQTKFSHLQRSLHTQGSGTQNHEIGDLKDNDLPAMEALVLLSSLSGAGMANNGASIELSIGIQAGGGTGLH
ncbi:hypothetical protein BVRB_1g021060 isoform A [Beta vulgaris subsp. vulgaris]|nr:hypothetical protein BVRB_1g021060 isoform A [Beta vulgaris subsp. vulgaris]